MPEPAGFVCRGTFYLAVKNSSRSKKHLENAIRRMWKKYCVESIQKNLNWQICGRPHMPLLGRPRSKSMQCIWQQASAVWRFCSGFGHLPASSGLVLVTWAKQFCRSFPFFSPKRAPFRSNPKTCFRPPRQSRSSNAHLITFQSSLFLPQRLTDIGSDLVTWLGRHGQRRGEARILNNINVKKEKVEMR